MKIVTIRYFNGFCLSAYLAFAVGIGCSGGGGEGGDAGAGAPRSGTPTLSVSGGTVAEGDAGSADLLFTVSLSQPSAAAVRVDVETRDGSAVAGDDYVGTASTLTIPAGGTRATVAVAISGDVEIEADESLMLALANPVQATIAVPMAAGTIENDDFPVLDLWPADASEGSGGGTTDLAFRVSLSEVAIGPVTVDYATSNVTALAPGDYALTSGSVTFAQGELEKTIVVGVVADDQIEADEELTLSLASPSSNAELGADQALGTIRNDDFPEISISHASALEGDVGTQSLGFLVSLEAATNEVRFDYRTIAESASDPSDFTGTGGVQSMTIPAGTDLVSISVPIHGDAAPEPDETFRVELSNLSGDVVPGRLVATGTIHDDDSPPATPLVRVSANSVDEGDPGSTVEMTFHVTIDPPAPNSVRVSYQTQDESSAEAPADYLATNGQVTVPSGGSASFSVTVVGDDQEEELETFLVALERISGNASLASPEARGFILDDDATVVVEPTLSVRNTAAFEGDSGFADMLFDVALSAPVGFPVSVDYATSNDTALAGSDYTATSGTLTIPAGETLGTIGVPVTGDLVIEADEQLRLTLSNVTSGVRTFGLSAVGRIQTDDPLAQLRVANAFVAEGDDGTTELALEIFLDQAVEDDVSVAFTTEDATATLADGDYDFASDTAVIPAGGLQATVVVTVFGDERMEDDEKLQLRLSDPSGNASILDELGEGTILNDDGDGGWQDPELVFEGRLEGLFPIFVSGPAAALGPGGEARAMWVERTALGTEAVSSVRSGATWEPGEVIGPATAGFEPSHLAFDGSGQALAVWYNELPFFNTFDGLDWGAADPVADARVTLYIPGTDIQLASNAAGEAMAVWAEYADPASGDYHSAYAARFVPGSGWQETGRIETDDGNVRDVHVGIDRAGNAAAVWLWDQDFDDRADVVRVAHYEVGTGWLPPETIDTPGAGRVSVPMVAMNGDGLAAISWDGGDVFVSRYDGADWSAARSVVAGIYGGEEPGVDIDDAGNVFVVWREDAPGVSPTELWANRYDASLPGWQGPQLLAISATSSSLPILYPQVKVDAAGNAIAVWVQGDHIVRNVRAVRYSQGAWESPELLTDFVEGDNEVLTLSMDRVTGDAIAAWIHSRPAAGSIFNVYDVWTVRYLRP